MRISADPPQDPSPELQKKDLQSPQKLEDLQEVSKKHDEEKPSFFENHYVVLGLGALAIGGVLIARRFLK